MRAIGTILAVIALTGCGDAKPEVDKATGLPKATERQRLQILEMRADAANPVGIYFSDGKGSSAIFSARGVPVDIGITGVEPAPDGYRVKMWVGNLSSVPVSDCFATFALSTKTESESKEIPLPGVFSPAKVERLDFIMPAKIKNAAGLFLSAPVCTSAFYPD